MTNTPAAPTTPRCLRCGASWVHRDDYAGLGTPHKYEEADARSTPAEALPERPSIEDEWYEQDSGGGDDSAKGADVTPAQAVTSLPRPNPSPEERPSIDVERLAAAIYNCDLANPITFHVETVDQEAARIAAEYDRLSRNEGADHD